MDATLTPAAGVGVALIEPAVLGIPRSVYLYENKGMQGLSLDARSLYAYENVALQAIEVEARALYLYENYSLLIVVLRRSLYLYEATRDTEVFPWLMRLAPDEQVRGGQVDLYGDGLGEIVERGADVGNTVTASSTNGSNVPENATSRTASEWVSNDGTSAWLRIAFSAPRNVVGVALEDRLGIGNLWGVPRFRFSDGGPDVNGATAVPQPIPSTDYAVGSGRLYYALPSARLVDWIEVRIASGGAGANRGLSEVWVYADEDVAAEDSQVLSNLGLITEAVFGIVAWSNRSPGLYPANSGLPIQVAATVTVPNDAESGMVRVRENT